MRLLIEKNRNLRRILIVIIVLIVLLLIKIFISFIDKTHLNWLAVNDVNGDIALSYYEDDYIVVKSFDKFGNEKFQRLEDDNGGVLSNLFYDKEGYLHIYLGRCNIEKICDSDGTVISINSLDYSQVEYWKGWKKKGSSYNKTVNQTLYCYDYAGFFELLWNPTDIVYLQNGNADSIVIWTNQKNWFF